MAASKLFFNPPSRLLNICSTKDRVVLNFKHPGIVKKTTWRRLQESACRTLDARILGINYAFSKCSLTKSTSAARGHEDWYIFDDFSNCFSECGYVSPEQSSATHCKMYWVMFCKLIIGKDEPKQGAQVEIKTYTLTVVLGKSTLCLLGGKQHYWNRGCFLYNFLQALGSSDEFHENQAIHRPYRCFCTWIFRMWNTT